MEAKLKANITPECTIGQICVYARKSIYQEEGDVTPFQPAQGDLSPHLSAHPRRSTTETAARTHQKHIRKVHEKQQRDTKTQQSSAMLALISVGLGAPRKTSLSLPNESSPTKFCLFVIFLQPHHCQAMPTRRSQPQQCHLKVGTDFTGLNSPLLALWGLQIPVTHVFACDNDPPVQRFVMTVMKPKLMLNDIRHRYVESMPKVDYFHVSPPCISFSSQARRPGDVDGLDGPRDFLFDYSLSYIKIHTPKLVTFEQVSSITRKKHT